MTVLRPPPLALRLGLPGPKHKTFRLDDHRRRCNVEAIIEPHTGPHEREDLKGDQGWDGLLRPFLEKLGQLEPDSNRLSDLPRLRPWKRRRIHEQVPTGQ